MSSHGALALAIQVLFAFAVCFHSTDANSIPLPCIFPCSKPTTTLVVYLQDIVAQNGTIPANATLVPVAGIQGTAYNLQQQGTIFVADDNITATASPNSTKLGQALGTVIVTSPGGLYKQVSMTLAFSTGAAINSSLILMGAVYGLQPARPVAIVGGTGIYTFATGNATFETVFAQGSYTVRKLTAIFRIRN